MPTPNDIYNWLLAENIWATSTDVAKAIGGEGDAAFDFVRAMAQLLAEGRVRHEAIAVLGADGVVGHQSMYSAIAEA